MKKFFYVLQLLFVLLFLSCTMGGVEWGLIGTWELTKNEGSAYKGFIDYEATMVINCNDTYTINNSYKSSDYEWESETSGTVYADITSKTLTLTINNFEVKRNGVLQSINMTKTKSTFKYTLNCNDIILDDTDYDAIGYYVKK